MKNRDISIEIFNAVTLSFDLNNEIDFQDSFNPDNIDLLLNSKIGIDIDKSTVGVELELDVVSKTQNDTLFKIKSFFEFGVSNLNDVIVKGEKGDILELGFSRKLLNISIGGTRGMLSVYLKDTQYNDFTLPIANIPDEFFPKPLSD